MLQSKYKKTTFAKKTEKNIFIYMFGSFPHKYQMDAKDCGPACLKIIAKYHKNTKNNCVTGFLPRLMPGVHCYWCAACKEGK
jgi:hypothetical protein